MKTNTAYKILQADFESGAKNGGANFIKRYWAKVKDRGIACWLDSLKREPKRSK
jgi:hypothetical protein